MQLASQVLPMPAAVRVALPSYAFLSWNGLFTSPPQLGSLIAGIAVSLAWAATATALAYLIFMRRDFTAPANDGSIRRGITLGIAPLLAVWALSAAVVAGVTGATGSGIDAGKLQQSLATSFGHLYVVQSRSCTTCTFTAAQLRTTASCTKGSGLVAQEGPGNDWRCYVNWHIPGVNDAAGQAVYQLDVSPNGRYVADGDGPNRSERLLRAARPVRGRTEPAMAVRRPCRSAHSHIEGIGMQVTRQRRKVPSVRLGLPKWAGRRLHMPSPWPPLSSSSAGEWPPTPRRWASATTRSARSTQRTPDLRRPDPQANRR